MDSCISHTSTTTTSFPSLQLLISLRFTIIHPLVRSKQNKEEDDEYIPEERIEEFREAFSLFDEDRDGSIDMDEFVKTLRSLGQNPSQLEIDEMIRKIDANGDGEIDFEEFKVLMFRRMKETDASEEIRDSFLMLDSENRGYVSAGDIYRMVKSNGEKITPEEAKELVNGLATKSPGKINFEEFSYLVRVLVSK